MIFQHHRVQIWNANQHPYRHTAAELAYTNPALGTNATTLKGALDWILKVVYPQPQAAVATVAALPAVGNTLNDYRVVQDDGDGKAAGYRWEQREGDVAAKWYKIYDMDWGVDSVLSGFFRATQDHYYVKYGADDIDSAGAFLTGVNAGQHLYGGASASTNLTLHANAGDGTGAQTGYVQFADQSRPTSDNSLDLGTAALRFRTGRFGTSVVAGTLTASSGSLSDSGGTISFGTNTLTTSGPINGGVITGTSHKAGTLTVADGSITDTDGTISFGSTILTTSGAISGGVITGTSFKAGTLTMADGSITDTDGTIAFGTTLITANVATLGQGNVDNLRLDGNTLSVTNAAGNLVLSANGAGVIDTTASTLSAATITSNATIIVNNTTVSSGSIGSTASTFAIYSANGTVSVTGSSHLAPADVAQDLGATASRWRTIYLSTSISDGTTSVPSATIQSLRGINVGVASGDTLSWNGSQWVPVNYDTTIPHSGLTGLTSGDDHTQYALLAGRTGNQSFTGGLIAGDFLQFYSNAGSPYTDPIYVNCLNIAPVNASLTDLGTATYLWRDIYMVGQARGLRLENFTTAGRPAASASKKGRAIWDTDLLDILVDSGGTWVQRSTDKYYNEDASGWTGSVSTVSYTVDASISDTRKMVWQLKDNSNNYKVILADITHTGATNVTVTVDIALAAGTYTLVGVG